MIDDAAYAYAIACVAKREQLNGLSAEDEFLLRETLREFLMEYLEALRFKHQLQTITKEVQ